MIKGLVGAAAFLALALLAGACGGGGAGSDGRLNVVTTVAPLTNIALNIGGDRINLKGIIPEGTDSHTFEPRPSDARLLSQADLIILNGLTLETPTEKLAEANKKSGAVTLKLGDNTITRQEWIFDFSFPQDKGNPNPHLWLNVAYAESYARLIRDKLAELDPKNKAYYDANAERYLAKLDALDKAVAPAIQTVPPQNRKLLTYHDSWPYFAKRYGMTVIGAIQPSDFSEPSPQEVASLINQLRSEKVPALFGSEVFPSKVLDQIGREAGVKYITTLRDDDLPGKPGQPQHTYVGMMLEDVKTMVESLGGNADALKALTPDNTYSQ